MQNIFTLRSKKKTEKEEQERLLRENLTLNYEFIKVTYFNVCFYLGFRVVEDRVKKEYFYMFINSKSNIRMRDIAEWCNDHKILYVTAFECRKDYSWKENLWNWYSYCRFKFEMKFID